MNETIKTNRALLTQHRKEFMQIFGHDLARWMHPLFGFDVIAFDDKFIRSDERSVSDVVTEKYGERANELLRILLNPNDLEALFGIPCANAQDAETPLADLFGL